MQGFIKLLRGMFKVWCCLCILFGFSMMAVSIGTFFKAPGMMALLAVFGTLLLGFLLFVPGLVGLFWNKVMYQHEKG